MSQARDLLAHARSILGSGRGRPKQAELRIVVTCAYRALFQELRHDAVRKLIRGRQTDVCELRRTLSRCFEHRTMANAARAFAGQGSNGWIGCVSSVPADLVEVAEAFAELYEARHRADYDQMGPPFRQSETSALLALSERACETWARVRDTPAGRAYLLAMLIKPRS